MTLPFRKILKKYLAVTILCLYCFFSLAQDDNMLTPFQQSGLWGYKNKTTGAVVVTPQYDFADYLFADGLTKVSKYKKAGLINIYGTEVVSCKYDDIIWNTETHSYLGDYGLIKVIQWKKYGLIKKNGNEVTTCKYDEIGSFADSIAPVKVSGMYGYINYLGKEIIPCNYTLIYKDNANSSLLKVIKNSKYGVYNKYGKEIATCSYDEVEIDKNGLHVMANNKYGLISQTGKIVVPCEYDTLYEFYDSLAIVKKTGKFGFFSKSGTLVIPCLYDKVVYNEKKKNYFPGGKALVQKDGKYGIIDKKGNTIVECKYDWEFHLPVFADYTDVTKDGMKGIIDKTGKEVLACKYDEVRWDYDPEKNPNMPSDMTGKKLFTVMSQDKWGVVDDAGRIVIPLKYEEIDCFVNGLSAASLNGKWGYINMHDSVAVSFVYDYCQSFDKKFAIAGYYEIDKNTNNVINKFGLVDKQGKEILPFEYSITWLKAENMYVFSTSDAKVGVADSNGKVLIKPEYNVVFSWDSWKSDQIIRAYKKDEGKYGYYSKDGKLAIPFKYIDAGNFSNEIAAVREDFKWGYIDRKGKQIIPFLYDEACGFVDGLALVRLNARYGFVDNKGKEIIPPLYFAASSFCDGFAKVQENESTYGLIDKTGKMVIPALQDNILLNSSTSSYFTEGLAMVQLNGLFGYYDKQGVEVISCKYSWADFFSYNKAVVKDSTGKYRFIAKNGKLAFSAKYNKAYSFYKNYAVVKTEKTYQLIDTLGSMVKTFPYDEIKAFYDGPAAVKLGKLWGFIDEKGNEIITPRYEKASSFSKGEAQVEIDGGTYRINSVGEIVGQGVK